MELSSAKGGKKTPIDEDKINIKTVYYLIITAAFQMGYILFTVFTKKAFPISMVFTLVFTLGILTVLPKNKKQAEKTKGKVTSFHQGIYLLFIAILFLTLSESLNLRSFWLTNNSHFTFTYIKCFIVAVLIFIGFCGLIYGITGKKAFALTLGGTVLILLSLVNYYMLMFRDRTFLPHDFYAAQTAANVIGEYTLSITPIVFSTIQILILLWMLSFKIDALFSVKKKGKRKGLECLGFLAYGVVVVILILSPGFWEKTSIRSEYWNPNDSSAKHTFVLNFLGVIPYMSIEAPPGYEENVALLEEKYPSDSIQGLDQSQLPDKMIFIMNEAFADYRMVEGFETNQDPLPFWHKLSQEEGVISGYLVVNAFGGGTALSEFEGLTGTLGMALDGVNESAMQRLVHNRIAGLGDSMKTLGYQTLAMHPYTRSGWGRPAAYPHMGFDQFISLETMGFEKKDLVRSYALDEAFYKYMVNRIDPMEEPVFLFGVTMQNHGGYTWEDETLGKGRTPVPNTIQVTSPKGEFSQANQYFNLLHLSDKAFEKLINHYQNKKEKVVIIMYGDHLPAIKDGFEEALEALSPKDKNPFQNHSVPYMIWANYPLQKIQGETDHVSVNYLSVLIKEALNLPFTGFEKYLLECKEAYPITSTLGIVDRQGEIYEKDYMEIDPLLAQYSFFQYNNLTGKKGYMKNLYLSKE